MFAALCVLLAALGHVLMSDQGVPWWSLSAGFVLTYGAAWALASCERGMAAVTGAAVGAQTLLHIGFTWAQASPGTDPYGAGTRHAMHQVHGAHAASVAPAVHEQMANGTEVLHTAMSPMTGAHDMGLLPPPGMLSAHLLAALLCGLWLGHGERATFRLLRALAGWLFAPLRQLLRRALNPGHQQLRPRIGHRADAPKRLLLVYSLTSRGPPVGTAVL
ncbi:hypothetical protein [Streptomyces sp. NPDC006879]|uniref:hypothetical protein n=1 Tax=Streptomyces sp. NPDC006879 TaxID=3364767 RepID=UPI00369B799B